MNDKPINLHGFEEGDSLVPPQFKEYCCTDYFGSDWSSVGYWDESCQLMLIVPLSNIVEHQDKSFLEVGHAGVDGILIGYRRGLPRIWAYYPIEQEFALLANTLEGLLGGWNAGEISV